MICSFLDNILDLYLDGRLIPFQARLAERHLRSCGKCAGRLAELQKLKAGLRGLSVPAAPQDFKAGLKAALAAAEMAPMAGNAAVRGEEPDPVPAFSFAFSFVAFLLFISGSMFGPGLPSQGCRDSGDSICAAKEK
jgi:anti-sigma factor RsiW